MKEQNFHDWNCLVYYVSDIYNATKRFKAGPSGELAGKIRQTVISISASVNNFPPAEEKTDISKVYPILSAISVLETYLQLAKKYRFLKDTSVLDDKLKEVKDRLYRLLGQGE